MQREMEYTEAKKETQHNQQINLEAKRSKQQRCTINRNRTDVEKMKATHSEYDNMENRTTAKIQP